MTQPDGQTEAPHLADPDRADPDRLVLRKLTVDEVWHWVYLRRTQEDAQKLLDELLAAFPTAGELHYQEHPTEETPHMFKIWDSDGDTLLCEAETHNDDPRLAFLQYWREDQFTGLDDEIEYRAISITRLRTLIAERHPALYIREGG